MPNYGPMGRKVSRQIAASGRAMPPECTTRGIMAPKALNHSVSRPVPGQAGGIDFDVVPAPRVHAILQMQAALADFSIAPEPLSSLQLADLTVYADEEHRVMAQQRHQIDVPAPELDHVLDDQVVAGIGDRRGTAVESVEEARPDGPPRPLPGLRRAIHGRPNVRIDELVRRPIEERRAQGGLYGAPQGRLSGATRTVQEYDSRRSHGNSRSSGLSISNCARHLRHPVSTGEDSP